jgi:hypothetical protein
MRRLIRFKAVRKNQSLGGCASAKVWRASARIPQRFFRGTFFPFLRALESAMAIACLRLFTLPPLPAFVAVHLATDFLTRSTGIFSSALLSHLVSPLTGTKVVD